MRTEYLPCYYDKAGHLCRTVPLEAITLKRARKLFRQGKYPENWRLIQRTERIVAKGGRNQ